MQGILHRFHAHQRTAQLFNPESTLFAAAAIIVAVVTILILALGVFVTRAS